MIEIDFEEHRVFVNYKEVRLTSKQFKLLSFFIKHQGKLLTRDMILDGIYPSGEYRNDRTIDSHVFNLRKLIGYDRIESLWGDGYRFNSP